MASGNAQNEINDPLYDANKSTPRQQSNISPIHWILFIFYILAIFFLALHFNDKLPPPLSSIDAGERRFSEERARGHVERLTEFGPRPSGSDAAEKAKNYLLVEMEKLRSRTNENGAVRIEVDVQKPSACFSLSPDFVNCYRNVTNVVVRFGFDPKPSKHSLLVNCHFDSVPAAPGATDDASSCGVMLELLNIFTRKTPKELPHDLIFLFNGAEENFLQGSHGFITQHPWRHGVRAFVNLEGCGAGGREILFQAGPGHVWLSHAYLSSAPYPHSNILAQELFENDLIPSATDFQIFRDFGNVAGMDFAYIRNGYVYHTEFDVAAAIPNGSLQRSGENLENTIVAILRSPCFTRPCPEQDTKFVFFDVWGLFSVSYPLAYGTLLNYAVSVMVVIGILRRFQRRGLPGGYSIFDFVLALATHVVGSIITALVGWMMVRFAVFTDMVMCWYSQQFMVVPLYFAPTLITGLAFHLFVSRWRSRNSMNRLHDAFRLEQTMFDAALLILATALIALTYLQVASAYYLLIHVMFPQFRDLLSWIERKVFGFGKNAKVLFLCHSIALFPIAAVGSIGAVEVLQFFIPIMGRSGTAANSEHMIAAICVAASIVILLYMAGFIHLSKGVDEIIKFFVFGTVLMLAFGLLTPFGAPYRYDPEAPRLRRMRLQHVSRTIYDVDGRLNSTENALFITGMDFRGVYDLPPTAFLQGARVPPCLVEDSFCALPYARPSDETCPPKKNLWIPVPSTPNFETPAKIQLSNRTVSGGMVNMTFSIKAHTFATMFLTPLNNWTLRSWTLTKGHVWPLPNETSFVILHYVGRATDIGPWVFSLTLKTDNLDKNGIHGPKLLLGIASHYVYGAGQHSDATLALVKSIKEYRQKPPTASFGYWKWMITPDVLNSEYIAQYFE